MFFQTVKIARQDHSGKTGSTGSGIFFKYGILIGGCILKMESGECIVKRIAGLLDIELDIAVSCRLASCFYSVITGNSGFDPHVPKPEQYGNEQIFLEQNKTFIRSCTGYPDHLEKPGSA